MNSEGGVFTHNPFRHVVLSDMLDAEMKKRGETMADVEYITESAYRPAADFVKGEVITKRYRYIGEQMWCNYTDEGKYSDDVVTRCFLSVVELAGVGGHECKAEETT